MANNSSETGLMATYDANDTTVVCNGEQLDGWGQDTMFSATYDNDSVTVSIDPQGTAVASKQHKNNGTITLNVSEASPCNKQLDQLADNGNFPIDIVTSTTHITGQHCYIARKPEMSGAAAAGNRAWQIKALNMDSESIVD